ELDRCWPQSATLLDPECGTWQYRQAACIGPCIREVPPVARLCEPNTSVVIWAEALAVANSTIASSSVLTGGHLARLSSAHGIGRPAPAGCRSLRRKPDRSDR